MVQPGFLAVPPLVQQQMPSMPSAYNQIDLPQMPPMGHAYTNLQPMQTPQPYQGGTAGGPGPNFTDAIAAGYAQATSLNETVDSVPKIPMTLSLDQSYRRMNIRLTKSKTQECRTTWTLLRLVSGSSKVCDI